MLSAKAQEILSNTNALIIEHAVKYALLRMLSADLKLIDQKIKENRAILEAEVGGKCERFKQCWETENQIIIPGVKVVGSGN